MTSKRRHYMYNILDPFNYLELTKIKIKTLQIKSGSILLKIKFKKFGKIKYLQILMVFCKTLNT
jgi:hypothetical protein